jgi:CheY-like chemotaxis protein
MLRRLLGEDVALVHELDPALPLVRADPGQVEQILMNLAVNARDAMPHGGTLTIRTRHVAAGAGPAALPAAVPLARLELSDTGQGMTNEVKAHLFEPFFTTKEVGTGTGLGLATVYGIVQQSGGHIEVESTPGRGSMFRIDFPQSTDAASRPAGPLERLAIPRGTETILLVEDEERVRSMTKLILQSNGYHVLEARDGLEALTLCQQYQGMIHLLLTDVVMPRMGGRVLSEQVAQLRPAIRRMFFSGYTDDAIVRQGLLGSGVPFLPKPFTPGALARKVREVLDGAPPSVVL